VRPLCEAAETMLTSLQLLHLPPPALACRTRNSCARRFAPARRSCLFVPLTHGRSCLTAASPEAPPASAADWPLSTGLAADGCSYSEVRAAGGKLPLLLRAL
jgi:hypothetical protein